MSFLCYLEGVLFTVTDDSPGFPLHSWNDNNDKKNNNDKNMSNNI